MAQRSSASARSSRCGLIPALRGQLLEVAGRACSAAAAVDTSPTTRVPEAVSSPAKLDALLAMLDAYGTCELVRTGRIGAGARRPKRDN